MVTADAPPPPPVPNNDITAPVAIRDGVVRLPDAFMLVLWAVAIAWLWLVWAVHRHAGTPLGERLRRVDLGWRVVLASGLGNPLGFEGDAAQLGLDVGASLRFPDHHHFTAGDVAAIARHAAGAVVVAFNQPVVPLASVGELKDVTPPLVIEPAMKGRFPELFPAVSS
jgi:hypothetical protein